MKNQTIIFTGGGSGGHVLPALTLIDQVKGDFNIYYVGSKKNIEFELTQKLEIPFFSISVGKLRRYFSWENFLDFLRVIKGFFMSLFYLSKFSPKNTIVFSTGGYVSLPLCLAAKVLGFTIIVHEQTSRMGLANLIVSKFAHKILVSFKSSLSFLPKAKSFHTGYPLRKELFQPSLSSSLSSSSPSPLKTINNYELNLYKPLLFVTGGGNGSSLLNKKLLESLDELKKDFQVIHQVGKKEFEKFKGLKQLDYLPVDFLGKEMINLFKQAQVVISRAGAGTVCELLALNKRSILVPLKIAQKNEQFFNAKEAQEKLQSMIVEEKDLEQTSLLLFVKKFLESPSKPVEDSLLENGTDKIVAEIKESFLALAQKSIS